VDIQNELSTGSLRTLRLAVIAVVASFVAAAPACLPSVQFDSPSADGGVDGPASEAAQPTSDGGTDAPGDGNSASDVAPMPEAAPAFGPMASCPTFTYGQSAACIVRAGTLYCWGDEGTNASGQLGFPDEDAGGEAGILHPASVTTTVQPASQIAELVMSVWHTCALYGSKAYCWGSNVENQLGNPTSDGGPAEVPVIGLPEGLTTMAAASLTTCGLVAVADAGNVSNVYCWGTNGAGELGRPIGSTSGATAMPVTGDVDGGPLGVIPDALQIAGGGYHFCAITSDHRVLCWGATEFLESGPTVGPANCPGGNSNNCTPQPQQVTLPAVETPIGLALGDIHSCALTQAGNVYCWGSNEYNQLGAGPLPQTCPFASDYEAGCSGQPVQIGVSHIQSLYAGGSTTCAVDTSHYAYCWGNNAEGELGQVNHEPSFMPEKVVDEATGNPHTFDDMALGGFSVCGRQGNQVYCWGSGVLGTQTDAGTPNYEYPALLQF
jgi:alpha-tubulin suppressor-like RCC1 family protein